MPRATNSEDNIACPVFCLRNIEEENGIFFLKGSFMEKRVGFVGVIVENRKKNAEEVNKILSEFGEMIIVRTGVPHVRGQQSVIVLVVDATSDQLGAITGKLGALDGVSVKSMLGKNT